MKNIEIEFLTSKYNNDKESDYIEGHFTIHKTMSDNEFLKFLYWIWIKKQKNVEDFYYSEPVYNKFPVIKYKDKKHDFYFYGPAFENNWDEYNKNEIPEIIKSDVILNEFYEEYLKEKENFDFFTPLYKKAKKGDWEAIAGLLLLEKTEKVEEKNDYSPHHQQDIIYKLENGEYIQKHKGVSSDPWEDSSFEEEYIDFFFVKPIEKTIIEWKEIK